VEDTGTYQLNQNYLLKDLDMLLVVEHRYTEVDHHNLKQGRQYTLFELLCMYMEAYHQYCLQVGLGKFETDRKYTEVDHHNLKPANQNNMVLMVLYNFQNYQVSFHLALLPEHQKYLDKDLQGRTYMAMCPHNCLRLHPDTMQGHHLLHHPTVQKW
jgi:hypothetical protein